jgi:peptide/nickel transport system substrate-binding protein
LKPSRIIRLAILLVVLGGVYWWRKPQSEPTSGAAETAFEPGGRIVATIRSEPKSFNRFVSAKAAESRISQLTQSSLVRLNLATGVLEPRLAREWTGSPDGLTWTFKLRDGVVFSDGAPLSAADVVFTFQVLYDKGVNSSIAPNFFVDGKPLVARALDDHTVTITFPAPYGPGLTLLDALPILPRHALEPAFKAGKFREAWGVATPPKDIVGTGPFVIAEYIPGQRVTLARNPKFWRKNERGGALPYVDELQLLIVPEQNAETLRLESGDIDLANDFVRPEDYGALRDLEKKGVVSLVDAGVEISPSALWFNLVPGTAAAKDRPWLQKEELRRAISYAVDRQALINIVFLGAGVPVYGPITPGHGEWYLPDLPKTETDLTKAKQLLASIGLTDRNGDGMLEDPSGKPARFTLLTQKGNTVRESTSTVLRDQLKKAGLQVDVVPEDPGALIEHFNKAEYDAMFYGVDSGLTDPSFNQEMWLSSGQFHFWNPQQKTPATAWEQTIDDAMRQTTRTMDREERHKAFAIAQRTLAEHLPILNFAAQKVTVALSSRLRGAMPIVIKPPVLWNAEMLSVAPGSIKRP